MQESDLTQSEDSLIFRDIYNLQRHTTPHLGHGPTSTPRCQRLPVAHHEVQQLRIKVRRKAVVSWGKPYPKCVPFRWVCHSISHPSNIPRNQYLITSDWWFQQPSKKWVDTIDGQYKRRSTHQPNIEVPLEITAFNINGSNMIQYYHRSACHTDLIWYFLIFLGPHVSQWKPSLFPLKPWNTPGNPK